MRPALTSEKLLPEAVRAQSKVGWDAAARPRWHRTLGRCPPARDEGDFRDRGDIVGAFAERGVLR